MMHLGLWRQRRGVRISPVALGVAAVALVAAACGGGGGGGTTTSTSKGATTTATSGGSGGGYTVGSTSDLSGELAFEGQGLRNGINAYFTYVNAHGGVNGHQVRYVPLDDMSNPSTGSTNTKQLTTQDHASAILGWGLSNVIEGALPALQQYNMPIVAQSLTGTLLHPPQPLIFGGDMSIADEAGPEVAFASQRLKGKAHPKVALFTYVSAVDQEFATNVKHAASAKGWDVVADPVVQLSATDLTAAITQIANGKPDFVIMSLVDPQAILAVRGLRQMGIQAPIVNYDGGSSYGTLKTPNDANFFVLRPYGFSTDQGSGIATFDKATAAAGVDPNGPFVINGYTQAVAVVAGLRKCGYPCSSSRLATSLENLGSVATGGVTVAPLIYNTTTHAGIQDAQIYGWNTQTGKAVKASGLLPVGAS